MGPLDGVPVADFSRVPAGPYRTVLVGPVVDVRGCARVANPLRLSSSPGAYGTAPPGLDADATALRAPLSKGPS